MITRGVFAGWAVLVALCLVVPANAGAQPAIHSSLDPVRLATDFAPGAVAALEVRPFELAAADSFPSPVDSIPAAVPAASDAAIPPLVPQTPAPADEHLTIVGPILGAIVGGAVGLYGGGGLALALFGDEFNSDDYADLAAVVLGATVGEVFLMPAGAHLGNGSKGSYWSALGGSALGFLATLALSYAGPVGTLAGVAVQVALTVSGERRSAKRKAAERAAVPVDAVR